MATVEKRGNSYRFVVFVGRDNTGKQIKKYKTISAIGVTKTEAKRLAAEFENDVLKKTFIDDKNLTLKGFIEYWQTEYAHQEGVYSPKTIERNNNLLDRIIPALGHIKLKKLKPPHLLQFYNNLREPGMRLDRDKIGKLSPRTIQMHHKLLSAILNKAKQWQFIEINPCNYVDPPKSKSKQIAIFDEETLLRFFECLFAHAKTKYVLFFLIAFSTGLRRGEILALRWQDIDLDKMRLRVNQSALVVKGKGIIYKDPKTEKSNSNVSISPSVIPILQQHKAEQELLQGLSGGTWDNDLLFTTVEGKAMFPSTVSHWLKDFLTAHNLPIVSVHSFRHMSVTYALDRGFDLKAVSERARHTQVSTTTDIYGHALPQKDVAIAASLDEIIIQAKGKKESDPIAAPVIEQIIEPTEENSVLH